MKMKLLPALLTVLCGLSACVETGLPDDAGSIDKDTDAAVDTVELEMLSFKLLYYHNDDAFSDIVRFDITGNEISGYLSEFTDLTSLIVDFEATGRVYVGDVEQVSGVTPNDFTSPVVYRLEDDFGNNREYVVTLKSFTGLPVVYFDTESGMNVRSKEEWEDATIRIAGAGGLPSMEATPVLTKGRGNSTWNFRKKQPYALKFDKKTPVLGMPKHKRWILMANYRDRTMFRNAVAFEISNRTGLAWAPRVQFVELVMNGKHRGSYMVTEQIRIDENRINITEMEPADISGDAITGGYVLEVDQWDDEKNMFKSLCMENKWGNTSCTVMLKFPDEDDATPQQFDYIRNYFLNIELSMMNGDFQTVYDEYIDMDSFIDFWFVQELTGNKEPWRGPYSTYMYKDRGGKLFAGPVWDFDFTTFMQGYSTRFYNEKSAWYKLLLKDETFRKRMKERWNEQKDALATIPEYIDRMERLLTPSAEINWSMYDPASDPDIGGLYNGDESLPYAEAVKRMRDFYVEKFNWMDEQFKTW